MWPQSGASSARAPAGPFGTTGDKHPAQGSPTEPGWDAGHIPAPCVICLVLLLFLAGPHHEN